MREFFLVFGGAVYINELPVRMRFLTGYYVLALPNWRRTNGVKSCSWGAPVRFCREWKTAVDGVIGCVLVMIHECLVRCAYESFSVG